MFYLHLPPPKMYSVETFAHIQKINIFILKLNLQTMVIKLCSITTQNTNNNNYLDRTLVTIIIIMIVILSLNIIIIFYYYYNITTNQNSSMIILKKSNACTHEWSGLQFTHACAHVIWCVCVSIL